MKSIPHLGAFLAIAAALLIIDLSVLGLGTKTTLELADPSYKGTYYYAQGKFGARALAFELPNWQCKRPSEFLRLPIVYSGTKRDILFLTDPVQCGVPSDETALFRTPLWVGLAALHVVDIPFSLIADSVMLPVTIPRQRREGNIVDPPYFRMGTLRREAGDAYTAKEYYEKGVKVLPKYYGNIPLHDLFGHFPDLDDIAEFLGQYHLQRQEYDRALFYYEEWLEMGLRYRPGPGGPVEKRYRELARVYTIAGNPVRAQECNDKAEEYANRDKNK